MNQRLSMVRALVSYSMHAAEGALEVLNVGWLFELFHLSKSNVAKQQDS
jgi:hypothetical protein